MSGERGKKHLSLAFGGKVSTTVYNRRQCSRGANRPPRNAKTLDFPGFCALFCFRRPTLYPIELRGQLHNFLNFNHFTRQGGDRQPLFENGARQSRHFGGVRAQPVSVASGGAPVWGNALPAGTTAGGPGGPPTAGGTAVKRAWCGPWCRCRSGFPDSQPFRPCCRPRGPACPDRRGRCSSRPRSR